MSMVPFNQRKSLRAGAFDIPGSFAPAGTNPPTDARGKNYTVARTGVGEFLITLAKRIPAIDAVSATPQCATAGLFTVEVGETTSTTMVIRTLETGVPVDVAADPSNRVHFTIAVGGN